MQLIDDLKSSVPTTLPAGKSRTVYIVLAVLLGALGIHNFWVGGEYAKKAKAQLILGLSNLCCLFCGIPGLISWVTAIIDATSVKEAA